MTTNAETTNAATPKDAKAEAPAMVVGLDGSPGATKALYWAAAHTSQFGPIQPVATWRYPWWAVGAPVPGSALPIPESDFVELARTNGERMLEDVPMDSRRELIVTRGAPGPTLVKLAEREGSLVVGSRGRGAVTDTLLGSVSGYCVGHATVPVFVVPEHASINGGSGRIVVGIDGSDTSISALRWAIEHALPDTKLDVIHTWSFSASALPEVTALGLEHVEKRAVARLDETLEAAQPTPHRDDVEIVRHVVYGDAREHLRDAAVGADLLVLGARGHGGLAHLVVGSVTTALCHQPNAVTVVVPASKTAGDSTSDRSHDLAP